MIFYQVGFIGFLFPGFPEKSKEDNDGIIDLCWGSFLSASVSVLSYFTITRFFLP